MDLELLRIQAEDAFDDRGHVIGLYGITIACAEDRQELWIGAEVPNPLAAALTATFDGSRLDGAPSSASPGEPPPALERCRHLLKTGERALHRSGGPSFLIGRDTHFVSELHIERSDTSTGKALRAANPGNWHPVEWDELIDGRLGPWAIAIEGGARRVALSHATPVTARAAECGVWTHLAFRGRGYAAAVTASWAEVMRPSGHHLFYSTTAENLSSQRVARRLGLRPIGWTWRLGPARGSEDDQLHPLCSLRQRR